MKSLFTVLLLPLFLGCATQKVKYSELRPPTTATISGNTLTIHLGGDLMNSASWTRPNAKIEGQTVYIVGFRSLHQQSADFHVRLPVAIKPQSLVVVWIDPDGSYVPVPVVR